MAIRPVAQMDGDAQTITLKVVDDSTGTLAPGFDLVTINLADLANGDGKNRWAKFRKLQWKDPNNACTDMQAFFLMTEPEAVV